MGDETTDTQQLLKKVKLFEAIVNKTENGIIVFNDQFEVIFANQSAGDMLGTSPSALRGAPLANFIPKDRRDKHEKLVSLFSVSDDTRQELYDWRTIQCCRQDGTEFPAKITIEKFIIAGAQVYITSVNDMTDITYVENKKNEVEMDHYYALQQKKYSAQTLQASLAKNLTKIAKIAQTLKANYDIKPLTEQLGVIMNSAFSSISLSQRAIFVSQLGEYDASLNLVDRSLYGSFERIRDLTEIEAMKKKLTVAWDIPSVSREFKVQQCQTIEQIFYSVVEDAIGNAVGGEITIQLSQLHQTKDNKINIEFQCSNSRFGVPQQIIDEVLNAPSNEDIPKKNNLFNNGMSLRLANHLTQQQGGKMRVISHPIEGTKIFIKLSVAEEKTKQNKNNSQPPATKVQKQQAVG